MQLSDARAPQANICRYSAYRRAGALVQKLGDGEEDCERAELVQQHTVHGVEHLTSLAKSPRG